MTNNKRSVLRHPMAAIGLALFIAGLFTFIILVLMDITGGHVQNPYRSLVAFVLIPAVITIGFGMFILSVWFQIRKAKKKGEEFTFRLIFNAAEPNFLRNLGIFLGILSINIILIIYSGTEAYEATDSVEFCGKVCHEVMSPQFITYQNSSHARVPCVECHIGPGASFYVKSKIDGTRQLIATFRDTYDRPIPTPVHTLRPARETCEGCHWPQQFYGEKMLTNNYYRSDEENSPWTIKMLVKIGGGHSEIGKSEGIHFNMLRHQIDYIATDKKRQEIGWVRVVTDDNDTLIYTSDDRETPDPNDPNVEVRRFDCLDCHNRPSHNFEAPAKSINQAIYTRKIDKDLPSVRETALDLLIDEYETKDEALAAIESGLTNYYEEDYPEIAQTKKDEIQKAVATLKNIYSQNFFPEMKTDYRVRENNLSHFVNDGCFRCHDGTMTNQHGITLTNDCRTCHIIVAQGSSEQVSELENNLAGMEFIHPEDIDKAWQEMKCTECHTPESGY